MSMLAHIMFFKGTEQPKPVVSKFAPRSHDYGTVRPRILAYLKEHPDCTPNELREQLELNRYSVDRGLRVLHKEGLVEITTPAITNGRTRAPAKWRAK